MINHKNLTNANLHPPGYFQSSDPGAIGAGKLWVDTTTSPYVPKIRNVANDGWVVIGSSSISVGTTTSDASDDQVLFTNAGVVQGNAGFLYDNTAASRNLSLTGGTTGSNPTLFLKGGSGIFSGTHIRLTNQGYSQSWDINHSQDNLTIHEPSNSDNSFVGFGNLSKSYNNAVAIYPNSGKLSQILKSAGTIGHQIKLASSQTADAVQILNNSDVVLAKFAANGALDLGSSGVIGSLAVWYGASKFMQTDPANSSALMFHNSYKLSWVDGIGINGQNTGIVRFSDGIIGVNAGSGIKGGIDIGAATASMRPLSIKLASSQTADAVYIEDNAGGEIFSIDANGNVIIKSTKQLVLDEAGAVYIAKSGSGGIVINDSAPVVSLNYYGLGKIGTLYSDLVLKPSVTLTKATATDVFTVALPTLGAKGGCFVARIVAKDASDAQVLTQRIRWSAVNKAGTYTTNVTVDNEGSSVTTGTITASWTITTQTNQITLRCNANPSLTPTTLTGTITHEGDTIT